MIPDRKKADCDKAPDGAREQRMAFAHLMKVDLSKCVTDDDKNRCAKMEKLAEKDPLKWDAMLTNKDVVDLFRRGALYFGDRK